MKSYGTVDLAKIGSASARRPTPNAASTSTIPPAAGDR